jgi:large subunit ribosomal protein L21
MYAVIESGGKQYRVELGTEIQVDRLEVQPGDTITLDRVLLVADEEQATVGRPFVEGAVVNAAVVDQARGEKVVVFKYRPKARRRVKKGFRASLTTLRISDIAFGGASAARDAAKDERKREQATRAAEQSAADQAAADQALAARLATAEPEAPAEAAPPKRARTPKSAGATPKKAAPSKGQDASATTAAAAEPAAEVAAEPAAEVAAESSAESQTATTDKDE